MKDLLTFMGEHPWLTFFLVIIIGETIVRSIQAIRGVYPPAEKDDEEEETE